LEIPVEPFSPPARQVELYVSDGEDDSCLDVVCEDVADGKLRPANIHQLSVAASFAHKLLPLAGSGMQVKVRKLNLLDDSFVRPETAREFEWILPDDAITHADWHSEYTERKGFLTCIETYCNVNDLLAVRLTFNTGKQTW